MTVTTGGGGSATGNYLDISEVRPINLQVATRCKALGERTGLGIGEDNDPAYTLQEQHSHAVFAVVAYDESQITSPINASNPKINAPCHSLCATNAGRTLAVQLVAESAIAVYPMRDPNLNKEANGFIVSENGAPAPTLSATDRHAVAACFSTNVVCDNSSGNDIAGTLDANYYRGTGARSGKEREFIGLAMFENNSRGGYKEGCGTLRASGGDYGGGSENLIIIFRNIAYLARCILRKLTPLECERLQGFPDYWTKYGKSDAKISDTARWKALGNSLTVPCAERVFRGIIAAINGNEIK